jgi:hypothetical protein
MATTAPRRAFQDQLRIETPRTSAVATAQRGAEEEHRERRAGDDGKPRVGPEPSKRELEELEGRQSGDNRHADRKGKTSEPEQPDDRRDQDRGGQKSPVELAVPWPAPSPRFRLQCQFPRDHGCLAGPVLGTHAPSLLT